MVTSVLVFKCAVFVMLGVTVPSQGKKTDTGEKILRNVIITSFGEMPYEPAESGGYYQSDIMPLNFNDEVQQQTMDIALRTGILVEDPNEKKSAEQDEINDEIVETTLEDETSSTNAKRHTEGDNSKVKKQMENNADGFLSPRFREAYRKSEEYVPSQDNSDTFLSHPLSYGYEFVQKRKSQLPYRPYPSTSDSDGDNVNIEYYADLGEGWSLEDAEKVLKGSNYNILVMLPGSYNNPDPNLREMPPPPYFSEPRHHHQFYLYPSFEYGPGFEIHRGPPLYPSYAYQRDSKQK